MITDRPTAKSLSTAVIGRVEVPAAGPVSGTRAGGLRQNPAHQGHRHSQPHRPPEGPHHPQQATVVRERPREEWLEIPVPPLVTEEVFWVALRRRPKQFCGFNPFWISLGCLPARASRQKTDPLLPPLNVRKVE